MLCSWTRNNGKLYPAARKSNSVIAVNPWSKQCYTYRDQENNLPRLFVRAPSKSSLNDNLWAVETCRISSPFFLEKQQKRRDSLCTRRLHVIIHLSSILLSTATSKKAKLKLITWKTQAKVLFSSWCSGSICRSWTWINFPKKPDWAWKFIMLRNFGCWRTSYLFLDCKMLQPRRSPHKDSIQERFQPGPWIMSTRTLDEEAHSVAYSSVCVHRLYVIDNSPISTQDTRTSSRKKCYLSWLIF